MPWSTSSSASTDPQNSISCPYTEIQCAASSAVRASSPCKSGNRSTGPPWDLVIRSGWNHTLLAASRQATSGSRQRRLGVDPGEQPEQMALGIGEQPPLVAARLHLGHDLGQRHAQPLGAGPEVHEV